MAREGEERLTYSTDMIRYSIGIREKQYPVASVIGQCVLAEVRVGSSSSATGWVDIFIPFTHSSRLRGQVDDEYYRYYEAEVTKKLHREYEYDVVQRSCAMSVAQTLTSILRSKNAAHRCAGQAHAAQFNPLFEIHIRVVESEFERRAIELDPNIVFQRDLERALGDSFVEAAARANPANTRRVEGLIRQRRLQEEAAEDDAFERGWKSSQCVICIEEIETRASSLTMPCSHVFHQDCLAKWFLKSHVCPLCRYNVPNS